jgi:chitodextrinase
MKKYTLQFIYIAFAILAGVSCVHAAENTFQVRFTVTPEDNFPPSIPTGLDVVSVSSSQIDLVWNASTDDVGVAGYRIFRDGSIIASTTNLSYSDSGLSASTTYLYEVEAFDSIPRYSGTSTTMSTTTLEVTIVVPPATTTLAVSSGSSGYRDLIISALTLDQGQSSVIINFTTNQSTQAKVYWGMTTEYELGSISGLFYNFTHAVSIDGLIPGTRYYFKVEATNASGRVRSTEGSFLSHDLPQEETFTNVDRFKAIARPSSIDLSWNNPSHDMFDSVRVVRSDRFFPRDIYDGQVVYEGRGQSFGDDDVQIGTTYYYSIFARDTEGNYSSGALAKARIALAGEIIISPTSTDPFVGIRVLDNVDPTISRLTLMDFDFIQDGRKLVNIGNPIGIDGSENITIRLDYDKVPEILKTIAITLIDPDDSTQVFPFLLRVNKDKSAYEATVAPLGKRGTYNMNIVVLDHKNQGLKRLEGDLRAFVFGSTDGLIGVEGGISYRSALWFIVAIIIIMVILIMIRRRYHTDVVVDNTKNEL